MTKNPSTSPNSNEDLPPPPPLRAPKKGKNAPPPVSPSPTGDVASAYSLGETLKDSPLLNSTLLNAMRDYFGDDGREVQDYMKRPRNARGEPMFRVVLVGSGPAELEAIQKLKESGVISGLYYCPDEDAVCDIQMSKFGQSATVSAYYSQEDVVRFSKWVVADAVFVGPDRDGCISNESESALAEAGITLFPHDVCAAVADGSMSVLDCLKPLDDDSENAPAEQLVE